MIMIHWNSSKILTRDWPTMHTPWARQAARPPTMRTGRLLIWEPSINNGRHLEYTFTHPNGGNGYLRDLYLTFMTENFIFNSRISYRFIQFSFSAKVNITVNYTVSYLSLQCKVIVPTDSLNKIISENMKLSLKMADLWTWNLHGEFLLTQRFNPYSQNQYWLQREFSPEFNLAPLNFIYLSELCGFSEFLDHFTQISIIFTFKFYSVYLIITFSFSISFSSDWNLSYFFFQLTIYNINSISSFIIKSPLYNQLLLKYFQDLRQFLLDFCDFINYIPNFSLFY